MTRCIFCKIAAGTASAQILHRSDRCLVFFDTAPIREGHVQIIPRAHYTCFDDMPAALAAEIMMLGQRIAKALKAHYGVSRVGFVYSGNDVAHAHAHVVPLLHHDDITSARYFAPGALARRSIPPPAPAQVTPVARALQFQMGAV